MSVQKENEEQTRINIDSQPLNKATMVDYGKNYENVQIIADYFKSVFSEAELNNMTRWQDINVDELEFKVIKATIRFEHIDSNTGEKQVFRMGKEEKIGVSDQRSQKAVLM